MIEVFKTETKKTLYAVTGTKGKEETYKKLAAHKKESLATTKKKHKKIVSGYMIENNGMIELYELGKDKLPNGVIACQIVGL